ncbi:MCE family protein [Nocardia callitridis]|uniref:MCE family protein n=1 Tax=Nocardia callitridis TaxID=648753 RepID=A0ABP9KST8_9NOCA
MKRSRVIGIVGAALAVVLLVGAAYVGQRELFGPRKITAIFTSATAIYAGDDVRVSGVKVGRIASVRPHGTSVEMELAVDHGVSIPAQAEAVIVSQSLIAARYVQLTPAYRTSGPTMADGAVIPLERTAVPVEWDEVKTQLTRLSAELGPDGDLSSSATGRFIDSAADAMGDNGDKLRTMVTELSGVGRILADGSGNIVDIIKNLQTFVTTLRDSNTQIVQFENRLATLTSVLDDGKSDLDAALRDLSVAIGDVTRFVSENRDRASEQVRRLGNVTQNLVDHKKELEQLLHAVPSSLANFVNIYDPNIGEAAGVFVLNNFSNPLQFVCAGIGSIENATSAESAKKCVDYLGPVLGLLNFNYLPVPVNPVLGPAPRPENLHYTEPDLVPTAVGDTAAASPPPPLTLPDLLSPWGRPPS